MSMENNIKIIDIEKSANIEWQHFNPQSEFDESFCVSWDGINDKENVKNRPLVQRYIYALLVLLAAVAVTTSSSIYALSIDNLHNEFHKNHTVNALGITLFLFGMGVGPMFLSPISEQFGRKKPYIISLILMICFSLGGGFGKNIQTILICRFLGGFSGSCFMGVSAGSVSDLFSHDEISFPVFMYTITPFLGAGIGPLISGFINQYISDPDSWRWTFHVMTIYSAVILLFIIFVVPETYPPILLRLKAERIRKAKDNDKYYAPIEHSNIKFSIRTIVMSVKRPTLMLIKIPMLLMLCIYCGLLLSLLYGFFVSYPYVFKTVYLFTPSQTGLAFIGIIVGCLACIPFSFLNDSIVKRLTKKSNGINEPEFQLVQTIIGSIVTPVGLFIFGWSSKPFLHWIGPIFGGGIVMWGSMVAMNGIFSYTIRSWHPFSASAMACNGVVRSTIAAVFPLFGLQMYQNLGIQWASTLLALLCVIYIPMPICFFFYGKKIRSKSTFNMEDVFII